MQTMNGAEAAERLLECLFHLHFLRLLVEIPLISLFKRNAAEFLYFDMFLIRLQSAAKCVCKCGLLSLIMTRKSLLNQTNPQFEHFKPHV